MRNTALSVLAIAMLMAGTAQAQQNLENPAAGSFQSGVGVISGWACNAAAATVEVQINGGTRLPMARGTPRSDTASVCGRTDTGFGLLVNYNSLGAGTHSAQLLINGAPAGAARQFTVVVPAGEFATGLAREVTVSDFPAAGQTTVLVWQESQQNFAIKSVSSTGGALAGLAGSYQCVATGTGSGVGTVNITSTGFATVSMLDSATGIQLTGTTQLSPDGSFNATASGSISGASLQASYIGRFQQTAGQRPYGTGTWSANTGTSGSWICQQ